VWALNRKEIRHQTSAASGTKTQSHNAMQRRRLCSASVCTQPRKDKKETTIKMVFSFPPEERVPFSQPKKDDGVHVAMARAPSQRLSVRVMGQHNNQKGAIGAKKRQERNNNQNGFFLFLLRRGCPSHSQGKMMARDTVARAPSQCLSARAMGRHNNQKESCARTPSMLPLLIFHFHL
jgi:hypothetical protein